MKLIIFLLVTVTLSSIHNAYAASDVEDGVGIVKRVSLTQQQQYHQQRSLRKKDRKHRHDKIRRPAVDVDAVTADKEEESLNDEPQDTDSIVVQKDKRDQQHSKPHSKEVVRFTRLKKKLRKNIDKFTADEIAIIDQEMDNYMELVNSVPDFQASIKQEHELHREIKDKEVRKAKFEEIKIKYQMEREKYKGTIDAGKKLYKSIKTKIDNKISGGGE